MAAEDLIPLMLSVNIATLAAVIYTLRVSITLEKRVVEMLERRGMK